MYNETNVLTKARKACYLNHLLKIKLCVVVFLGLFMQVSANGFAQKINLTVQNAKLKDVFGMLRAQTGYDFLYNTSELNAASKVSVNLKDVTLNRAMDACLENQPLIYSLQGTTVLIKAKKTNSPVQQDFTVSGIIYENVQPLGGVGIRVKGTNITAVSGSDGKYTINAKNANATLVFSFIGYATQEIKINSRAAINITMKQEDKALNEVVVVGYGAVEKKDLTGSVAQVEMKSLLKAPVASFDQALAGRIAGVQVSSNEGQPGEGMNIVIRGGNSLTQSNSPLYVIDGFPIEDPLTDALNPDDIESITILKDASATAIYGSRGANGVVIIETKKGKTGKTEVAYDASLGVQEVTKRMEMMNPYEFVKYQLELQPDAAEELYLTMPNKTLEDYRSVNGIDWQDKLFKQAVMNRHNLSIRGGNPQTKYAISLSYIDQGGVIINSGYKRYQGRISLNHDVTTKLSVGANINYAKDLSFGQLASTQQNGSGFGYSNYLLYHTWGYRPIAGGSDEFPLEDELNDPEIEDMRVNPIISVKNEVRNRNNLSLLGNIFANYTIIKGLDFRTSFGIVQTVTRAEGFYNSQTARGFDHPNNTRGPNGEIDYRDRMDWVNENVLSYKKSFAKKHNLNLTAGVTFQRRKDVNNGFTVHQVPNEELELSGLDEGTPVGTSSRYTGNTLASFLARANYGYASKYLFTLTMRADGSSKFSPENHWGYFPSGAFAWNFSRENFLKNSKIISDGKLRVSYGATGNNAVGDFSRLSSITLPYASYYSFNNGTPRPSAIPSSLGNSDLRWETTKQTDIGLDLSFLKNRIHFVADAYRKVTKDLLLNANVPNSSGYTRIFKNVGSISNEGLEFTLKATPIRNRNFVWESDFNISFNRNKVLALAEGEETIYSRMNWAGGYYNDQFMYMTGIGMPAASFYGYDWLGVYQISDFDLQPNGTYVLKSGIPNNGSAVQPGHIKYRDVNGDGQLTEADQTIIGRALPKHIGGFNNNFSYKGFSLNVFFQWSYGNDLFNANRLMFEGNALRRGGLNQYASFVDRWSVDNQGSQNNITGGEGPRGMYSDRVIEDGSYLRLKTVSLSYALPKSLLAKVKIDGVEVYASGQNLLTWTNYTGMDPEVSVRNTALTPGFDYSAYPRGRTLLFGVKVRL